MSGWGNQAGILYQQARAVLECLSMLDGDQPDVFAVHVESRQNLFDLELLDANLKVLEAIQIKSRQLEDVWTPSDIYPLLEKWADEAVRPPRGLQLMLGGRIGSAGAKLQRALCSAFDGDLTELRNVVGSRLNESQIEAAAAIKLVVDPTPTTSLFTAGSQQAMSLLPNPRTGPDSRDEADSILGKLNLLVQQRAGLRDASQRIVTRPEIAALFGIDEREFETIWQVPIREQYIERVVRLGEPKTVGEDLRRQLSPIERAAGQSSGQATRLVDLLGRGEHSLISGQSGTGKSTAAAKLRYEASAGDKLLVVVNAEAFIPGRLAALVSNALTVVLDRPIGVVAGRAVLADRSAVVAFDGASEMTLDQRRAFADELSASVSTYSSCRLLLVGRDPAVLNSLLPRGVAREAFVLRGIQADQRQQLVREILAAKGRPTEDVSRIAAQASHALKDAASVPYLLAMAAELISYGFDIKSRAQMYSAFTEQMAERQGLVRLQFCTLALGIAFNELLNGGRRQCGQFEWAQLLAMASRVLAQHHVEIDAGEIENTAREGGFVSYENYDQTVRPVHDSMADYFSALALSNDLVSAPTSLTENDALRIRFLSEIRGVPQPIAKLITSGIPFASVEMSEFDRGHLSVDTPNQVDQLLRNLLPEGAIRPRAVQVGSTADGRVFVFRNIGDTSRFLEPAEVMRSILTHGARETQPGALQIAVSLWKEVLEEQLAPERTSGRIPSTEAEAIEAVKHHRKSTEDAVRTLVDRLFPLSCSSRVLDLALPESIDIAILPGLRTEEPFWPIVWRASESWQVRAVDFEAWKADGENSGWGSVDSMVRKSPLDTAKSSVGKAVNELVDMPWLD